MNDGSQASHRDYGRDLGSFESSVQLESTRPSPALNCIIADAVIFAERILQRIDAEWPAPR
jgi:hypothetical protein